MRPAEVIEAVVSLVLMLAVLALVALVAFVVLIRPCPMPLPIVDDRQPVPGDPWPRDPTWPWPPGEPTPGSTIYQ